MKQKKYRPGMNCEKNGKYTCYDANGNEMYSDVDVKTGKTFSSCSRRRLLLPKGLVKKKI